MGEKAIQGKKETGMTFFPCFDRYYDRLESLSDEAVGRLFRALMVYHTSGTRQELNGPEAIAFDFIAEDIDEFESEGW